MVQRLAALSLLLTALAPDASVGQPVLPDYSVNYTHHATSLRRQLLSGYDKAVPPTSVRADGPLTSGLPTPSHTLARLHAFS